jgi:hypothetical protein
VLEHVNAVQIVVGDGVDGSLERNPDRQEPEPEVEGVLALGVDDAASKPGVAEVKR